MIVINYDFVIFFMKNSYNIDAFLFLLENFVFILNGHVFQFFVGKEKPEMKKKRKIEIRKENKIH